MADRVLNDLTGVSHCDPGSDVDGNVDYVKVPT